ncbi:exported hypothetical protein [Verrucomicrobia bacterium]|nr:exported hypothetical protein [Verrucomicrobiota bacterium]
MKIRVVDIAIILMLLLLTAENANANWHHVPDAGGTSVFLLFALGGLAAFRRFLSSKR